MAVPAPVIVARPDHTISRKNIDADALRVLYRLHANQHTAYLVGGSVRDLLLGRTPKDFDIGTDAHPNQIKRLFRNCWIIGRRFRLAHIKFGTKTIEVATFRRIVPEGPADEGDGSLVVASAEPPGAGAGHSSSALTLHGMPDDEENGPFPDGGGEPRDDAGSADHSARGDGSGRADGAGGADGSGRSSRRDARAAIHRDNTFGTPEEDAFRRDFTINGLFYDIATHAVIDYVGGLEDLERRVIRSIGDPLVRFVEDPVRMLRAAVFAARLGFDLDAAVLDAIAEHRLLITKTAPARLLEEYFKILRSGHAEATFRMLGRLGLLELMTPELKAPSDAVWDAVSRIDTYRQRYVSAPPTLTNAVLIGSLLVPLDALSRRPAPAAHPGDREARVSFGMLPVARRDIERLRQITQMFPRMLDPDLPTRVSRSMVHRPSFDDALVWLEIFGDEPDAVMRWTEAHRLREPPPAPAHPHARGGPADAAGDADLDDPDGLGVDPTQAPGQRRRRRRRRRRR